MNEAESALLAESKRIAGDGEIRECLFLVKNGIPFDVAFSLSPAMRLAWVVVMAEMEGGTHEFDWSAGRWVKKAGVD